MMTASMHSTETQAPKKGSGEAVRTWSGLTSEQIRSAYEIALSTRASIVACMTMKTRGEGVEFWIGGPGEEIHGTATALALDQVVRKEPETPGDLAMFCHYRSDALAHMTATLRGYHDFVRSYFRQALSRQTDPHSAGRQMVMHLCMPEVGLWPVQSPVGMQLSKAAGYARGIQAKGGNGLAVAIVGDGTTGESDFHEAAMAASVWKLPLLIIVTDNRVAITVTPEDGRGIKNYELYAQAFGLEVFRESEEDTRRSGGEVEAHQFLASVFDDPAIIEDSSVGHRRCAQPPADDFGLPGAELAGDILGCIWSCIRIFLLVDKETRINRAIGEFTINIGFFLSVGCDLGEFYAIWQFGKFDSHSTLLSR